MNFKLLNVILLYLFFASACTPAKQKTYSLTADFTKQTQFPKEISNSDIKEDVEFLKYALRNAYSGYFFKNKKNVDEGIKLLEKNTLTADHLLTEKFCKLIAQSFSGVLDNHLTFQFESGKCSQSSHKRGNVGSRLFQDKKKLWFGKVDNYKGIKVLAFSVSYFPHPASPDWNGLIEAIHKYVKEVDLVVFDLRGNAGGDSTMGQQIASALADRFDFSHPAGAKYKVTTNAALETRQNYFSYQVSQRSSKREKEGLKRSITIERAKYSSSSTKTMKISGAGEIVRAKSLKPIYILQDKGCGSSCESTIDYFEHIDGVTRVGENTRGMTHFGDIGITKLPKSQIIVTLPTTFNSYRDDRFIEKTGITPDVVVPKGRDAYSYALDYFNSNWAPVSSSSGLL